ncbi:hypothetical protein DSL72_008546 [Monilinia vaccinii-corymbosi]|uniref:Defect at low temperature protein 1 n=1 Tax=Monilinia vaccinii-corymbosi TaxID=61207 RepID=A0A8A3PQM6_9HELO|nr:hypothetical protein DSL72_008546 [Monilinia vaccinii-corymbosi]
MKLGLLNPATWNLGKLAYDSSFYILYIVITGLLLVTPVETFLQAQKNHQLYNIFVIASCYGATACFGFILLMTRIWTERQIIKAIPKTWIPIEKGDVNKKVRKMIVASLERSAAIAWDSRPRIDQYATITPGYSCPEQEGDEKSSRDATFIGAPKEPVWGQISHNGWSSPTSADLPSLQYITVILELPHLIEAKAVSLAPPDPQSTSQPPMPDLRAVDILQRPAAMGLRDYISHLSGFGIIGDPSIATSFLAAYEYARFSNNAISEVEFHGLMKQFAELLRKMEPLSSEILISLAIDDQESDFDSDASSSSTPVNAHGRSLASSLRSVSIRSGSEGTTAPSRRLGTDYTNPNSPVAPRGKRPGFPGSQIQSRGLYSSSSSSSSMRSTSQTSVIKLSRVQTGGSLPYEIDVPRVH